MANNDLTFGRGEADRIPFAITEDDDVTPVPIDDGVLKWWVNKRPNKAFIGAEIVKKGYDAAEIEITDGPNGAGSVIVCSSDTDIVPGVRVHCGEFSERLGSKTTAGTVSVTAGSGVLVGAGIDTAAIKDGWILQTDSADPANAKNVTIDLELDVAGVPTGNLVSDYTGWTTEGGLSFTVYEAELKRPVGFQGDFTIAPC